MNSRSKRLPSQFRTGGHWHIINLGTIFSPLSCPVLVVQLSRLDCLSIRDQSVCFKSQEIWVRMPFVSYKDLKMVLKASLLNTHRARLRVSCSSALGEVCPPYLMVIRLQSIAVDRRSTSLLTWLPKDSVYGCIIVESMRRVLCIILSMFCLSFPMLWDSLD